MGAKRVTVQRCLMPARFAACVVSLLFSVFSVQAKTTITVVGDDNYPPYLFKDSSGTATGLIVDVWRLWEKNTGVRVNLVSTSWAKAQQQMLDGQADVIEMIFRTAEREPFYSFSAPYETVKTNIYTLESITGVLSAKDLSGFVVGVQEGDACISALKAEGVKNMRLYPDYRQMINEVLTGNIKIFCMDELPADYYTYLLDDHGQIRKAFTLYIEEFHRAVRKGEAGMLELVERGMAAIRPEQLEELDRKWKGRPVHELSYSKFLSYGALAMAFGGGVLLLWITLLRLAVRKKTTELRAQSQQTEQERIKLQEIIDATRAGTWEWNVQTDACVFNERWADMLGYTLHELQPVSIETWKSLTHPDDQARAMRTLEQHFSDHEDYYEIDFRMRHKDGRWIWISDRGKVVSRTQEGQPLIMRGTHIDINERKLAEEAIWRQAHYDSLTALPNRRLFNERLSGLLKDAERNSGKIALLTIDIDEFKEVNDTLGHPTGDQLIVQAGQRIERRINPADMVARFSGDEFNVLVGDPTEVEQLDCLIGQLLEDLSQPYVLGEEQVHITASVGVSIYPDDAHDTVEMLRHSDQAMYAAKSDGRNRTCFFTEAMQESAQRRMQLIKDLRKAIENDEFEDYYQPIVELATGRIHKAEALLRWKHPTRGFVSPAEFIPVAEEVGLIVQVGDWIFKQATANVQRWLPIVGPTFSISVNKSPAQFRDKSMGHLDWVEHLRSEGLPGKHIVVEITEGLLMRNEPIIEGKLKRFREAGMQFALDDFGTGYSSLSYLAKFDINYLKIDQSFTRDLAQGSQTFALCSAIVKMAHSLGLEVIAEGVETKQQKDLLEQLGCDYAQGYFYSKPVSSREFQKLIESPGGFAGS